CNIHAGDTVAVWGCGGVGLMAQKSAFLLGARRVIGIDRYPERLQAARENVGSETINYEEVDSVLNVLQDITGGRGPDSCIDAVGMEAHGTGLQYRYDRAKQALRMHTDRGDALREAIMACRKGGTLSILGVYGVMDKFPVGVMMNKGLTVRTAQQHGQKYLPRLLEHTLNGELDASFLATHHFSLEDAPRGYDIFQNKANGCLRVVFSPQA
ncbi:MAG: zinc-binding dehydrogenase, partial [Bryobacterales bacterium]|nr:zinc-binding dehydrogenase [Bryobacterales bacterium]